MAPRMRSGISTTRPIPKTSGPTTKSTTSAPMSRAIPLKSSGERNQSDLEHQLEQPEDDRDHPEHHRSDSDQRQDSKQLEHGVCLLREITEIGGERFSGQDAGCKPQIADP